MSMSLCLGMHRLCVRRRWLVSLIKSDIYLHHTINKMVSALALITKRTGSRWRIVACHVFRDLSLEQTCSCVTLIALHMSWKRHNYEVVFLLTKFCAHL